MDIGIPKKDLNFKNYRPQKNKVNGSVKLKLYKGNIIIVSRQTSSSVTQ